MPDTPPDTPVTSPTFSEQDDPVRDENEQAEMVGLTNVASIFGQFVNSHGLCKYNVSASFTKLMCNRYFHAIPLSLGQKGIFWPRPRPETTLHLLKRFVLSTNVNWYGDVGHRSNIPYSKSR